MNPLRLLLLILSAYHPEHWRSFPAMDDIRCISATGPELYVAVPAGVYVFDRAKLRHLRTLTRADGIVGEVRLCAHNPSRGDAYVATDEKLYRYVPATRQVEELSPPFQRVNSIGVDETGAFFETDAGAFFRGRGAPDFKPVAKLPEGLVWYGEMDTLKPQDFPFLTPYFVTDRQLVNHRILKVRPDKGRRRLFAAVENYGLVVYNVRTGFSETHLRMGPTQALVKRMARLDDRLWFIGGETAVGLDSAGEWQYFLTRPGDVSIGSFRLLWGSVSDLTRSRGLNAVLVDPAGLTLGTDDGVYLLDQNPRTLEPSSPRPLLHLPRGVQGLFRLGGDSLLLGTETGLFLSSGDSIVEYSDPYGATDWGVFDIAQASNGAAYFGALGGIVSRRADGAWFRYVPPGADLRQPVRSLAASGTRVFMSTGSGVTVLDTRDDSYAVIDTTRGLPTAQVSSLYADDRYLWIASPGLITRLDYSRELK